MWRTPISSNTWPLGTPHHLLRSTFWEKCTLERTASKFGALELFGSRDPCSFELPPLFLSYEPCDNFLRGPAQPAFDLGILHDGDFVAQLAWCPRGGFRPAIDNAAPRLGLLAAVLGDGSLQIFSVPLPSHIRTKMKLDEAPMGIAFSSLLFFFCFFFLERFRSLAATTCLQGASTLVTNNFSGLVHYTAVHDCHGLL